MITALFPRSFHPRYELFIGELLRNPLIRKAVVLHSGDPGPCPPRCEALAVDDQDSGRMWNALLAGIGTRYLLYLPVFGDVRPDSRGPSRLIEAAESTGAGMVYAAYSEI